MQKHHFLSFSRCWGSSLDPYTYQLNTLPVSYPGPFYTIILECLKILVAGVAAVLKPIPTKKLRDTKFGHFFFQGGIQACITVKLTAMPQLELLKF